MFKIFNRILDNKKIDKYITKKWKDNDYKKFIEGTGFNVFISIMIFICIIFVSIVASSKPETNFYTVNTATKEIKPLETYYSPITSSLAIENWVANSVTTMFTFNFTNYQQHFNDMSIFFTGGGFDAFNNGLTSSGLLASVKKASLEVFITPTETPVITSETDGKVKTWTVEMSAFISYVGTGAPENDKVIISLNITQVPTYENPNGIAISDLNVINIQ